MRSAESGFRDNYAAGISGEDAYRTLMVAHVAVVPPAEMPSMPIVDMAADDKGKRLAGPAKDVVGTILKPCVELTGSIK